MIDFPSPILSVSTDVVKDLDGEDALYGMWTGALPLRILLSTSLIPAQFSQNANNRSRKEDGSKTCHGDCGIERCLSHIPKTIVRAARCLRRYLTGAVRHPSLRFRRVMFQVVSVLLFAVQFLFNRDVQISLPPQTTPETRCCPLLRRRLVIHGTVGGFLLLHRTCAGLAPRACLLDRALALNTRNASAA